jgi:hypothetical protein
VLDQAEQYQRAVDASVVIEKIGADGTAFGKGTAFWVGDGRLLTAFNVIDGATSLRIRSRDGSQLSTDQVIAWNRWQDWALLKTEGNSKTVLKPGPDPLKVGDRCVFLDLLPAGPKLVDGSVTGRNAFAKAGERLLLASGVTAPSFGGPLLDEYGNYVGIVGGNIVPGADPMKIVGLLSETGTGRATNWEITGMAVPSTLLPNLSTAAPPTRLADLASRGEFLAPVSENKSLQFATLASSIAKDARRGSSPSPSDERRIFSHRDNSAAVYATWQPRTKEKLHSVLRCFDSDNNLVSESKPRELSLVPGNWITTTWEVPVGRFAAGIYRVDLVLNDKTAWREFFRITE